MERLTSSPRTEFFSGKPDFLKGRPKFPNRISEWKMCVPLLIFTSSRPFGFDRLCSFREKFVVMERAHPRGNFYSGFDASHLLQLSTNRFLRVNGKQPLSLATRRDDPRKFPASTAVPDLVS